MIKFTEETIDAKFFILDEIPQSTNQFWTLFHKEVIEDYKQFKNNERLILK
ncbi:hypothetical protein AB1282_19950 [Gottfriedia sp. S16(2024)]|uniref:hypothetical protein n=1 Tax=Gottfriedia sp. S16(2024) TaxID=3162883 RepID=UPI003D1E2AAE